MDTVNSTNNWLSTFFCDIEDSALAIQQTEGKGRRGNIWDSKSGGLYFSFISSNHRLLPFITGISVVDSLADIKDSGGSENGVIEGKLYYNYLNINVSWLCNFKILLGFDY